jgi:hypothetical protein
MPIIDSLSMVRGKTYLKFGGELRMLTLFNDQLGGTTYSFGSVAAFLANSPRRSPSTATLSAKSPFTGLSGEAHLRQNLYILYAQDEYKVDPLADYELRAALRILPAAARRQQQGRDIRHAQG